ncbi:MAG: 5-(carboxyamino)imidazole ribonucleotide synthase [Bacteroidia bacterium]|nr:5-(carboxyamino)imidazole ribonucleotide synthase [Bacteroidia bacterium]
MLCQAASNWRIPIWILDQSPDFPASRLCDRFVEGNFKDYDDVLQFGRQVDILTIEIEHVNTDALEQLEQEGISVYPNSAALNTIKDKGLQKLFYRDQQIPTSPFQIFENKEELLNAIDVSINIPFVVKYRTAGYDGKGVQVVKKATDIDRVGDLPMMVEDLVDIDKEISVIAARNPNGEVITFPAVEMEFHPTANLVEYLVCPANISTSFNTKAKELAVEIIQKLDIVGLLAVEMFISKDGHILVNEVAPRPHNSGHQTIEGNATSQYEQHLRAILNLSLGPTHILQPSVMVNLLGADGYSGHAIYENIDECIDLNDSYIHLYGKTVTKPFRKMGHATVIDEDLSKARRKATFIKDNLIIKA